MAARKVSVAMAVAVAVVALLVVTATAEKVCGVDKGQVTSTCLSYCVSGSKLQECCNALKSADMGCLCGNYWGKLKSSSYARCASDIQSKCGLRGC